MGRDISVTAHHEFMEIMSMGSTVSCPSVQALKSELEAKEMLNRELRTQLELANHNRSLAGSTSPSELGSLVPYLSEHQVLLLKQLVYTSTSFIKVSETAFMLLRLDFVCLDAVTHLIFVMFVCLNQMGSDGEAGLRHLAELLELPPLRLFEADAVLSPTGGLKSFQPIRTSLGGNSAADLHAQIDELKRRVMHLQTTLENHQSDAERTQREFTIKCADFEVQQLCCLATCLS